MKALNIPVGISNFEKIRNNGFYYVDKIFEKTVGNYLKVLRLHARVNYAASG